MTSSLPEYVVLKCKPISNYLEYRKDERYVHRNVRFTGVDVHSPLSKLNVERAQSDSQLVHLRCCYNNKYLVASSLQWIAAEADKPEEDQSLRSCTLFQPVHYGGDDYRFKHMNTGNYAKLIQMGNVDPRNNFILPGSADPNPDLWDVFTVVDWKSLLAFPRHVAFKSDNDCFYGVAQPYGLQTATFDIGDPVVAHEVFPNPDGSIRIKSTHTGKFWMRGHHNWIRAESDTQDGSDTNTLFWPVKVDDTTIALRSLGNNQFCKRLDAHGIYGCLNASISSISKEARLTVLELALDRDIYNVNYHLSQAKRYNEHAVQMGTGAASNTTDKENSMDVIVAHTETDTNSWGGSISLKLGVKTTLKAGVPLVFDGGIEISADLTTAFNWGVVHTKTNTVQTVYKASVPPNTKVTVTAVGTTAMCDIPFSYTQTDTLINGTRRTYDMGGGTYTGVKTFNVTYQIKQEKINITE